MKKLIFNSLLLLLCLGNKAHAVEGMWQPEHLPDLEAQLKKSGLQFNPQELTNLVDYSMASVIRGYSPTDGSFYEPFTTLRGIAEKFTGVEPFNAPKKELEFIEKKNYGRYYNPALDSVAVNFLSDLDITGGNSGSPTLNSKGELVGLAFDGIYETIISNWAFTKNASAIHVDTTYMLWVMEYLDNAKHLLDEMTIEDN